MNKTDRYIFFRIGLFICFDIFFEQPWLDLKEAGVTTVAYPTAWIDELPFLTGRYKKSKRVAQSLE